VLVRFNHVARFIVNVAGVIATVHITFSLPCGEQKRQNPEGFNLSVKYWEIIIENLRNAGWNCGCVSSTDHWGRQF
jgi:hypothetical protein